MSVNYSIIEYPITGLNPFDTWAESDVFPQNIGFAADGEIDPPQSQWLQLDIIPYDSTTHYTIATMFTIAGQQPTSSVFVGEDPGYEVSPWTEGAQLYVRTWTSGETTTNTAENTVNCVLHNWLKSVTMIDMSPDDLHPFRYVRVVAELINSNTMIPTNDYDVILDIDGDAQLHPPLPTAEFFIDCEIKSYDMYGNELTPCAKVFPMIPSCYNEMGTSGWIFTPESLDDHNARIKVTRIGYNEELPLYLACNGGNPYVPGGYGGQLFNIQPWFHITPKSGYTLCRFNATINDVMDNGTVYVPFDDGSGNECDGPSIPPNCGFPFLSGVETITGEFLAQVTDLENAYGASSFSQYNIETTFFNDELGTPETSFLLYYPGNFYGVGDNVDINESGAYFKKLYLIDTLMPPITPSDFDLGIESLSEQLVGNNVIVMMRGLSGYIPGPNPPNMKLTINMNNCNMIGPTIEEEWIYFDDVSIYEVEGVGGDFEGGEGGDGFETWGEDE